MAEAAGDRKRALSVYRTTNAIVAVLSAGLLAIAGLFLWLVPFESWMELKLVSARQTDIIVFSFAAYVVVGL